MAGNLSRSNDLGIGQGKFLKAATLLCMLFLLIPLLVLIVYSFNASRQVTVWEGFSLKWFAVTLKDGELWFAIRNSLVIAGLNAIVSTALGTMTALAIGRFAFRGRRGLANLLYVPVVLPEIILGIALLVLFVSLGLPRGFLTVIIGHVTFSFPFVALLVLARVQALDRSQEEASLDLGASPWRTFHCVILPPLSPALLSGFLFAFTMSLDDFVISFFASGPETVTLPLKVYSMVKFGLTPTINVVSTLLIVFTLVSLMAIDWMQQDGKRKRWGLRLGGAMAAALAALMVVSFIGENRQEKLVIGNWAEYLSADVIDDFERQTGIRVVLTYFNDNEELFAKATIGKPGIDLIVPTGYMVELMRKQNLLAPFDFSRIPNYRHIDERFRRLSFDPDGRYYIPYTYGLTGLTYNSEKIHDPVDSWRVLWDARYDDRILVFNDMLEMFHLSERLLGYSLEDANLAQLDEALAFLKKQKPLLRKYESNLSIEMLLGGEADVAMTWNGQALRLTTDHPEFKFIIPKEGTLLFADNFCLLKDAPHPDAAHLFLNFLLDPAQSSRNMQYIRYAMPNPEAIRRLPPDLRDSETMFPPLGDMSKLDVMLDMGDFLPEIQRRWVRLVNE